MPDFNWLVNDRMLPLGTPVSASRFIRARYLRQNMRQLEVLVRERLLYPKL